MASNNANVTTPVPFPQPDSDSPQQPTSATEPQSPVRRQRTSTNGSTGSRIRSASLKFIEATPPPGMWAATGSVTSKAPTIADIRRGSFSDAGWNEEPQKAKAERSRGDEGGAWIQPRENGAQTVENASRPGLGKGKSNSSGMLNTSAEPFPTVTEVTEEDVSAQPTRNSHTAEHTAEHTAKTPSYEDREEVDMKGAPEKKSKKHKKEPVIQRQYTNGYVPPPKIPWKESTVIGLKGFWKWFRTPAGFLITLYGLNVVAWGGMLFLLLCNASPAMCHPTCDDIQSPRRIWIEIDSQILNALFCVTGFGLAPWRFRDLYWWGFWRIGGQSRKQIGIRRLAGIHRGWFRLPSSDLLPPTAGATDVSLDDPAVPIPLQKLPDAPPTAHRAPPTKAWKMDFVVWMNIWNTFFQILLCFYMYHYNRYERPSWATGTFVALGCIVAGCGGIMMHVEGKHIKNVEGVPIPADAYRSVPTDIEAQSGDSTAPISQVPTEHVSIDGTNAKQ
ncbi:hypothetical protein P280DRAFT_426761 [Massarina eburnea CBS 473.64]|uniref:Uncharacterized protein n=1 Tax=Massarina eburnea CBS 473.64 TaxID=1395130 RepID=A0A6A6S0D1_9PLEO|nr:hypothetical protein P280DRAFT_426761 [Massarina eburnea CBS 473.64]